MTECIVRYFFLVKLEQIRKNLFRSPSKTGQWILPPSITVDRLEKFGVENGRKY
jgi:hypothetical protein